MPAEGGTNQPLTDKPVLEVKIDVWISSRVDEKF